MNIILEILGIACFAWLFAEIVAPWIKYFLTKKVEMQEKKYGETEFKTVWRRPSGYNEKRLKPFDCPLCLAFWLGIIIFEIQSPGWHPVLYAAICSVLATFISKIMNRL